MIEIRILLDPATGALQLQGQVDNAVIAFGMLEMAKQVIARHHEETQKRLVQPAAHFGALPSGGHHG